MNIDNIDEVENLIEKLRVVEKAGYELDKICGKDGGSFKTFALVERDTDIEVYLPNLKTEVMDAIKNVLDDQHRKIVSRLKEI